jgi:GntR family transcriptional regulator
MGSSVAGLMDQSGTGVTEADPLYIRLLNVLRKDLVEGRYVSGSRLPSEGELARKYALSRHTVREALRRLRDEGLVEPRKGAGTVVMERRTGVQYVHEVASIEQLLQYAVDARIHVSIRRRVRSSRVLAKRLGCELGQEWLYIAGLRHAPGMPTPICWTEVYLHLDYADIPVEVGQDIDPIFPWIERKHGQFISEIEQIISAHAIPARLTEKLGVPLGSIGVEVRRIFRVNPQRVAQIAINIHPADRFRYSLRLRRAGIPQGNSGQA